MPLTLSWLTAQIPARCGVPKGQAENPGFLSVVVSRGSHKDQEIKCIPEPGGQPNPSRDQSSPESRQIQPLCRHWHRRPHCGTAIRAALRHLQELPKQRSGTEDGAYDNLCWAGV